VNFGVMEFFVLDACGSFIREVTPPDFQSTFANRHTTEEWSFALAGWGILLIDEAMSSITTVFSILFSLCPLATVWAGELDLKALQKTLVAGIEAFDRIELKGDGKPVELKIELGVTPVKLGDEVYDGFRFRCPDVIGDKDFVWYFNVSEEWGNWYIVPVNDEPGPAFKDWMNGDKLYLPYDKADEKMRLRILQTLKGDYFKPGEDYLMWFRKTRDGGSGTLHGTATFAARQKSWNHGDAEKALGLQDAPAEDQVAALGSRGGLILLDPKFFERGYAEGRIDSAFTSIRSTQAMKGGFFITMQIFVPPCATNPSLEEIIKQHGAPDFIREAGERDRVRKHNGNEALDEDQKGVTSYFYDHFSFDVKTGAIHPKVRRVGTYGCDFSELRAPAVGSSFATIGIENLTVFHRDGKEVGRAYYFLDGGYKPLFITIPPVGEYRSDDEVLISAGEGKWTWENRFPDGKVARRMPISGDQFHGEATGFHKNGKTSFKATYSGGLLNGDVIQFDEAGKEISRRAFSEGKPVK
jgi:hypothetical protein